MPPINPFLISRPQIYICSSCLSRLRHLRPVITQQRGIRTKPAKARKSASTKPILQQQPLPRAEAPADKDAIEADTEEYEEYQRWNKLPKEERYKQAMEMMKARARDLKTSVREDRMEMLRDIYGGSISEEELVRLEAQMHDEDQAAIEQELDEEEDKLLEDLDEDKVEDRFRATFDDLLKNMEEPDPEEDAEDEEAALLDMEKDMNDLEDKANRLEELVNAAKGEDGDISEEKRAELQETVENMFPEMADTVRVLKEKEKEQEALGTSDSPDDTAEEVETLNPPDLTKGLDEGSHMEILDYEDSRTSENKSSEAHESLDGEQPETANDVPELSLTAEPTMSPDVESWLIPTDSRGTSEIYIRRLNDSLVAVLKAKAEGYGQTMNKAAKNSIPHHQGHAWKWYILSRQRLLSAPDRISYRAWMVLWEVLCAPLTADRMAHINYLGSDMLQAGVSLTDEQRLAYIEAKYIHGDKDVALAEWTAARDRLGHKASKRTMKDFWSLGVWTCAQHGHLDLAFEAADQLFQIEKDPTAFRVLIDILKACLDINLAGKFRSKNVVQIAWAIYVRLLLRAGRHMKMADYDDVAAAFLHARQPELALGVFKDMMLSGEKKPGGDNSIILYKANVGSYVDLWTMSPDQREIRWEDSKALAKLPSEYNNKYFFGKWIKKLIGDGELDYAAQIVHLMQERGIRPDAIYLNGLIGAWLRRGTEREKRLGEELAWKMIATRIDFVKQRKRALSQNFITTIRAVVTNTPNKPAFRSPLATPQATIETFSVLLENYRVRQKQELMTVVYDAIGKAEVRPNTFFMNQLIMFDARAHRRDWAWDMYQHLVYHVGLRPDFDTFYALWTIAKNTFDPLKTRPHKRGRLGFPDPRSLFAEMMKRKDSLAQKDYLSDHLYELILRSFGVSDDQVGMAVAIQACALNFKKFPMEGVVRHLIISLARVGQQNIVGLRPRRLNLNDATKLRLAQVSHILATFQDQRMEALAEAGVDINNLDAKTKASESVLIMSNLLRYVAEARLDQAKKDGGAVANSVAELSSTAAQQMGVPHCDPWRDGG